MNEQEKELTKKLQEQHEKIMSDPRNRYAQKRIFDYPSLPQQLDLLFHDMTAGKFDKTGEWYKAINKVKADHPKPE
jgi:hypothetical protein